MSVLNIGEGQNPTSHLTEDACVLGCSFFFFNMYLFIYSAVPGLSCGMRDLLVVACRLLVAVCGI